MKNVLVTGGCGFIGSNWINANADKYNILNIDSMVAGSSPFNVKSVGNNYAHLLKCITQVTPDDLIAFNFIPDFVLHFAAESHVDRSIEDPVSFVRTNVLGTLNMLNVTRSINKDAKFVHVSTDEVFGQLQKNDHPFDEETPYDPRSPYSASKASSDHIVKSYYHTYGMNTVVTNCCNNFGPNQDREKLIPKVISNAIEGKDIPIYGKGENIREWIFVDDHNRALTEIMHLGRAGHSYCIGSEVELDNITLVNTICDLMDGMRLKGSYKDQIVYVEDRAGHDFRYAINPWKLKSELGWSIEVSLEEGLKKTIEWHFDLCLGMNGATKK